MHFALPRKTSSPPPYARVSARDSALRRRRQLQWTGYLVLTILSLYLALSYIFSARPAATDDGHIRPDVSVVVVTMLDEQSMSAEHIRMIKHNRETYAKRHGYAVYFPLVSTYREHTDPAPISWALLPALRHTLTLFPYTDYVFHLSSRTLITNTSLDLHSHLLSPLPQLMHKNVPVVPPSGVIHTFAHQRANAINLILTQDATNLAHTSLVLRNSFVDRRDSWTQYFLDAWFDPLYRTYAFQKAELHALEHILQWHPTLLAKLALVDQRVLNSYAYPQVEPLGENTRQHTLWRPGDFVINFVNCEADPTRDCAQDFSRAYQRTLEAESA